MNLRKKVTSVFATSAILLGLAGGMVAADEPGPISKDNAVMDVTCAETATVDVTVNKDFQIDATVFNPNGYSDTQTDLVTVVLDLSCNWSYQFAVDATIGPFEFEGDAPEWAVESIPGGVLQLHGGSLDRIGPDAAYFDNLENTPWWYPNWLPSLVYTGDPVFDSVVFPGSDDSHPDMIADGTFLYPAAVQASPGISTANWNGTVSELPPNLADGEYIAELTVTLAVE